MQRRDHFELARRQARAQTIAVLAAIAAAALLYPLFAGAAAATGRPAPDFVLKDIGGRNLRLSEFRGDVVVLTFWSSWCGQCRDALSELNDLTTHRPGEAPVVLSVNLDGDTARATAVANSLHLGFPMLIDAQQSVARLYDVEHLPLTLLVDRDGVVRGWWEKEPAAPDALARQIRELQRQ